MWWFLPLSSNRWTGWTSPHATKTWRTTYFPRAGADVAEHYADNPHWSNLISWKQKGWDRCLCLFSSPLLGWSSLSKATQVAFVGVAISLAARLMAGVLVIVFSTMTAVIVPSCLHALATAAFPPRGDEVTKRFSGSKLARGWRVERSHSRRLPDTIQTESMIKR